MFIFYVYIFSVCLFFFSSRRRHTRYIGDWSSDVCSSDLRSLGHRAVVRVRVGNGGRFGGGVWTAPQVGAKIRGGFCRRGNAGLDAGAPGAQRSVETHRGVARENLADRSAGRNLETGSDSAAIAGSLA